ncbi:hypothetical protein BASA81_008564 [Batrachochytrium salamandrivorans]|nr:hypothetical protein BASA81_008564 [Batrachochytrium salamandrivorans]
MLTRTIPLLVLVLGVWLAYPFTKPKEEEEYVFGFLPDYRFDSADFEFMASRVTHLCLFGSEADPMTGKVVVRLPSAEHLRLLQTKSRLKLFLGLGGAGRSDFFTQICSSRVKLARFKLDLEQKAGEGTFAGVELNWMFPRSPNEFKCLGELVGYLKQDLGLEVSMSLPPDLTYCAHVAQSIAHPGLDLVHIMMYQLEIGPGGLSKIEHLAKQIVHKFVNTSTRVTLGLPFYSSQGQSYEDSLSSKAVGEKIESAQLLLKKRAMAKRLGLCGVAIWELGQDCRPRAIGPHKQTCPRGQLDSLLFQITS